MYLRIIHNFIIIIKTVFVSDSLSCVCIYYKICLCYTHNGKFKNKLVYNKDGYFTKKFFRFVSFYLARNILSVFISADSKTARN